LKNELSQRTKGILVISREYESISSATSANQWRGSD